MTPERRDRSLRWPLAAALAVALLVGVGLRSYDVDRGYEYDELFTMATYVEAPASQVLFDVSDRNLPNNHRLSTLLIQRTADVTGLVAWRARLPSLLAGLLGLWLVFRLGVVLGDQDPRVGAIAAGLMATSAWHVYYTQAARGYALQTALMLGHALLWMRWYAPPGGAEVDASAARARGPAPAHAAALAALALAALVNIPLALLYLGPLLLAELALIVGGDRTARARRAGATLAWLAPCAAWGAYAWGNWQAASAHGMATRDLGALAAQLVVVGREALLADVPWPLLVVAAAGLAVAGSPLRLRGLALVALTLAPAGLALGPPLVGLTGRLGPSRTHCVLIPWLCLATALGVVALVDRFGRDRSRLAPALLAVAALAGLPWLPSRLERVLPGDERALVAYLRVVMRPADAVWIGAHDGMTTRIYLGPAPRGKPPLHARWGRFGLQPSRLLVVYDRDDALWIADGASSPVPAPSLPPGAPEQRVGRHLLRLYRLQPARGALRSGQVCVLARRGSAGIPDDVRAALEASGLRYVGQLGAPWLQRSGLHLLVADAGSGSGSNSGPAARVPPQEGPLERWSVLTLEPAEPDW